MRSLGCSSEALARYIVALHQCVHEGVVHEGVVVVKFMG